MLISSEDDIRPGNAADAMDREVFEEVGGEAQFAVCREDVAEDCAAFGGFEEGESA